jgi:pyruvate dehydrogenase E2 component (dihydrolipoamide acetyltransferase)
MADVLRMSASVAGESEAVLTAWLIPEGGTLAARDVIATVETAKAAFDVEAESSGILIKQLVREGDEVTAGAPIAVTGAPGETAEDAAALLAEGGAAPTVTDSAGARAQTPPPGRIFASPIARRVARDMGMELVGIAGTGPNGRIRRRDVESAAEQQVARPGAGPVRAATVQPEATLSAPRPEPMPSAARPEAAAEPRRELPAEPLSAGARDVPHSRLRRAIAARLTESKQTAPHFYLRGTADAEKLWRLKERLGTSGPVKITLNDLVIKAVAHAHARVPEMNVIWTPDAVRCFSDVDLSVAIATEDGLVTPVIRAANRLSVSTIAAFVQDQAERARTGRLRQQDLLGGVATITNLGMYGTAEFAAIINPPQSAILAVGAVREEPVARHGKVQVRRVMTVTLSVDHRPIDGVTAARWMRLFTTLLEDPEQILA